MTYILQNMMFIHIPKTGGHSVLEVMKANGGYSLKEFYGFGKGFPYHYPVFKLRLKLGEAVYDSFTKVSLVRNPWERVAGIYYARKRREDFSPHSFNDWMMKAKRLRMRSRDHRTDPLAPQSWMLGPEVIRFDLARIEELYEWMKTNLKVGTIEPQHVRSGSKEERLPYQELFTDATRQLVADANKVDIERHGWVF